MTIIIMINRYLISLFSSCFLFHLMKIEISKNTNRKRRRRVQFSARSCRNAGASPLFRKFSVRQGAASSIRRPARAYLVKSFPQTLEQQKALAGLGARAL